MYTEYVFENKKYEVALRDMKSALFDIISSEESKIASLRQKAFSDSKIANQADLQALFVRQDDCLRTLLSISKKLTKALQSVDTCSRELKQIEDANVAQIVATVYGTDAEIQKAVTESKEAVAEEARQAEPTSPMTELVDSMVKDEGDALAAAAGPADVESIMVEGSKIRTMTDDILAEASKKEAAASTTTPPVIPPEPDLTIDFSTPSEPVIAVTDDPVVTTSTEPVITVAEDTPVFVDPEVDSEEDTTPGPIFDVPEADYKTSPELPSGEEEPVEEDHHIFAYNDDLTTVPDEQEEEDDDFFDNMEDSYDEEINQAPERPFGEEEAPVITSASDVMERVLFRKRSMDPVKVIAVNKQQALNLRKSLSTQEALLHAKGIVPPVIEEGAPLKKEVENMMQEASDLYSEGKVADAQVLFDQIHDTAGEPTPAVEMVR